MARRILFTWKIAASAVGAALLDFPKPARNRALNG